MSTKNVTVTELEGTTRRDYASGDTDRIDRFEVQRDGRPAHVVEVRRSWDTGTPQDERCDCEGFRFRHTCCHVDAVYESGKLTVQWD